MPAVAQVLELAELVERDAAWKHLRADSAPVIAGLLGTHVGGDERRVDAEELYERIDADLERLRAQGLTLPLTAEGYCGEWRSASDAGRSFAAFAQLVLDPALGAAFEADIRRILDRGFARDLTSDERRALRSFLTTLKGRSAEIHDVITLFARGLRHYVQSQDYQRDRVLRTLLREAQHAVRPAAISLSPCWRAESASAGDGCPASSRMGRGHSRPRDSGLA